MRRHRTQANVHRPGLLVHPPTRLEHTELLAKQHSGRVNRWLLVVVHEVGWVAGTLRMSRAPSEYRVKPDRGNESMQSDQQQEQTQTVGGND